MPVGQAKGQERNAQALKDTGTVMVQQWETLLREVVNVLLLEGFKVRLDEALRNMIKLKMSLFIAGDLGYMTFNISFQPKLFYYSIYSSHHKQVYFVSQDSPKCVIHSSKFHNRYLRKSKPMLL